MRFKKNPKQAFSLIELSIVILIIGVLIAGVTQASRLIQQFRLTTARSLTTSSPVNSITGLTLWLDSTSEKSFSTSEAVDATAISNWYDINTQRTLTSNSVAQPTSGNRPLYTANAINGLPAVKFDGVDDYFIKSGTGGFIDYIDYNQMTVFLVEKFTGNSSNTSEFLCWNISGNSQSVLIGPWGGTLSFDYHDGSGGHLAYTLPNSFYNKTKLLTFLHNSSDYSEIRVDGALASSSSSITTTVATSGSYDFYVGAYLPNGNYHKGYFGELIVYNRALTAEEKTSIEAYLKKKWGIQ